MPCGHMASAKGLYFFIVDEIKDGKTCLICPGFKG